MLEKIHDNQAHFKIYPVISYCAQVHFSKMQLGKI